jgi:hypothetical protein
MPVQVEDLSTEVVSDALIEEAAQTLSPDDLRRLAEIIYVMMKEELRLERERLGR